MTKRNVLELFGVGIFVYSVWDNNSSAMDNLIMLSPFLFIFGLMYLILRK